MNEENFMREAIKDAKENGHRYGAIIVKGEKIISKSGNRPKRDARYHAEIQAMNNAFKEVKGNFKGCTLYSTCEPCPMCFYNAWINGISKIIFGATIKDSINSGIE